MANLQPTIHARVPNGRYSVFGLRNGQVVPAELGIIEARRPNSVSECFCRR